MCACERSEARRRTRRPWIFWLVCPQSCLKLAQLSPGLGWQLGSKEFVGKVADAEPLETRRGGPSGMDQEFRYGRWESCDMTFVGNVARECRLFRFRNGRYSYASWALPGFCSVRHSSARSCGSRGWRPMTSLNSSSSMKLSVWRRSSSAIIGGCERIVETTDTRTP